MNALSVAKTALMGGGSLVLLAGFTPHAYIDAAARFRCTALTSVPTMIARVVKEEARLAAADLSSVRRLMTGSAPPTQALLAEATAKVLGDGCYWTGDVMRRDENGFYFFVGRADDMFVCSAENIYPGEVEALLERHPAVHQASVVPIADEERGQIPIAFVVLRPGAAASEVELRQFALANAQIGRAHV